MKKLAILLTVALLIGLFTGCQASQSAQGSEESTEESTEPVLGVKEEKIYCTATLEDDFADDCVLVVITNIASLKFKKYTAADFPEIQCIAVQDLSTAATERVQTFLETGTVPDVLGFDKEVNIEQFHQLLCLTIENAGKQNVLDAIKELEKREDVLSAEPDYAIYLID